jgi:hypothetical protein
MFAAFLAICAFSSRATADTISDELVENGTDALITVDESTEIAGHLYVTGFTNLGNPSGGYYTIYENSSLTIVSDYVGVTTTGQDIGFVSDDESGGLTGTPSSYGITGSSLGSFTEGVDSTPWNVSALLNTSDVTEGTTLSFTSDTDASAVPEPTTFIICGLGAIGLIGYGWRRKKPAIA